MDLFMTARRLESKIARTLDDAAHRMTGSAARDPLEVIHAVVDRVEQEVLPAGRGTRVFPYNVMSVTLVAASPRERARYEALIEGSPTLRDRILERLQSTGAEVPDIDLKLAFAPQSDQQWTAADFHVELDRIPVPIAIVTAEAPLREPVELTIVRGTAAERSYLFTLARIDLGRGREVRDSRNDLLRTNHVAFAEGADEVNTSVSRRHAHITCDATSGDYRVYDDGSAQGTQVRRSGTTIVVRPGSRGIRLRDGDEIALGEARISVSVRATG